jgi:hypothetical protein
MAPRITEAETALVVYDNNNHHKNNRNNYMVKPTSLGQHRKTCRGGPTA